MPVRTVSSFRPFGVSMKSARRASRGSVLRCKRPRDSSRLRIPVSVEGCTCRISATRPAAIPGKRPTIRITRRCGPVIPKFDSIRFDADWSAWSTAQSRRRKSSTPPSGGSLPSCLSGGSVESRIVGAPTIRTVPPAAQRHLISAVSSLNSGVPATPRRSKSTVSVLVSVAPAFSQRRRPTLRLSSVREITASCATNTENPPRSRSRTVWKTQTWASIPTTIACLRPVRRISRAMGFEAPQENSILVIGSAGSRSRSGATVGPRPLGYCTVATTGISIRLAARISTAAFFSRAASAPGGIAVASRSCTSITNSRASARLSASALAAFSDGIALCSTRRRRVRIEDHVDAGDGSGRDRAFQGRADPAGLGDVLAMTAERFHHFVVPGGGELGGRALFRPEELDLGEPDLSPGRVVSDHHHHGQPEAQGGLEIHAVEPERAVSLDHEDWPVGMEKLRGDGERRYHPEAPERTGIEPASGPAQRGHFGGDGHPVAAVGHEHAVAGGPGHRVQLLGQSEMVDRHLIGALEGCLARRLLRLALAKPSQPGIGSPAPGDGRGELLEHAAGIADDADVDRAVAA